MHRCDSFSRANLVAGAALVAVLIGGGAAAPAMAQQPTTEDLIRMMEAQAKEIQALRERLQQVEAKEAAPAPVQPAPPAAGADLAPTVKVPPPLPGQKDQELVTSGSFPGSIRIPGTDLSFKVSGFAKADYIYDSRGVGAEDLFIVASLPTEANNTKGRSRIHARESRLIFDTRAPTSYGPFRVVLEGDFFGPGPPPPAGTNATADQLQTNSFTWRTRHLFGQLGPVLAGQWWTTFGDVAAYNETADFQGDSGRVFQRVPQIRYTTKLGSATELALAVENPEGDIFDNSTAGTNVLQVDRIPDFIGHLRQTGKFGHIQTSVVLREVQVNGTNPTLPAGVQFIEDGVFGWGVNVSGRIVVPAVGPKDNFKFQVNYGQGLGRFINDLGNNATPSPSGFDATFDPVTGELETVEVFSGYVGYQHFWTDTVRSTGAFSWIALDREFEQPTWLDSVLQARGNIFWSPVTRTDFGLEAIWGRRENVSGAIGANLRFQATAKYSF